MSEEDSGRIFGVIEPPFAYFRRKLGGFCNCVANVLVSH